MRLDKQFFGFTSHCTIRAFLWFWFNRQVLSFSPCTLLIKSISTLSYINYRYIKKDISSGKMIFYSTLMAKIRGGTIIKFLHIILLRADMTCTIKFSQIGRISGVLWQVAQKNNENYSNLAFVICCEDVSFNRHIKLL